MYELSELRFSQHRFGAGGVKEIQEKVKIETKRSSLGLFFSSIEIAMSI